MVIAVEFPELSEVTGPPAEYLRAARLSLLEEQDRSAIDEVRNKFENGEHHKQGHRHPHGIWHMHARDHKHGDDHGYKHGRKRSITHGSKLGPINPPPLCLECGSECCSKHGHDLPGGPSKPERSPEPRRGPPPPYVKDPNAPKDKGHFVLIIIGLFGLVHIMPFMFLFTANEYWMYKFRNTTHESSDANDRTYLQTNFASLNKLTVTAPGVICNFFAAIGGHKIKAQTRVFWVLAIHSAILVAQAVFATIDTDDWQIMFFIITMGLQMIMACAMSLGGSGSMGLISKLPPHYMKAQLLGEGVSSLFSAILRLISIFSTPSTVGAALIYFVTGSILMIGTSIIFYFATQTKFFKYYTRGSKEERKQKIHNVGDFKAVLRITWPMLILSVVPLLYPAQSVTNLVVSEYYGSDNIWGNKYFITICTYLIPAATGLLGRGIFSYINYDCSIPTLYILVLTREVIFGTLIFLSNAKPRHHFPVLLTHDWEYALTMAGNSLSSGFITILMTIKTMRMVPPDRIELSMMSNMFVMSVVMAATSPLGVLAVNLL